ncbi:MAG: hypothetical protein HN348_07535 [Proteobacteria bacterium]|jgi:hypothetical protein|nr:hypothetical protein [Pseudomonadota bacterium]
MTVYAFLLYIMAFVGVPVDKCIVTDSGLDCAERACSVHHEEAVKKTQVTPNSNLISISNGF